MCNKLIFSFLILAGLCGSGQGIAGGSSSEGGGDRPARFVDLASARGCAMGPYKYIREEIDTAGGTRTQNTLYLCVDGVYRRNGYVPKYPAPCEEGATRQIKEWQSYGDHDREVMVDYTCRRGVWRMDP